MRVLLLVDVRGPALNAAEDTEQLDDLEGDILEAFLQGHDADHAVAELVGDFTMLSTDAFEVSVLDAAEVKNPKDRRRRPKFLIHQSGVLVQTT